MKILVGVVVIMLVALVTVMAERSPPYSPMNGGPMVITTTEPVRGLSFGGQNGGCLLVLALIGLFTIIAGVIWLAGPV